MSKSRSGAPRRVAVGLLAGALTVFGIALAPHAGATAGAVGNRIAGDNRYGTSAAVAGQDDFDGATTAILATGETFPDALAASGLAGANAPAPIVLTQSDTYSDEASAALDALGPDNVIIVGGTAAISQGVQDDVEADGFAVTRVAGVDRYETAAAIGTEIGSAGQIDALDTALIATGTNFADALAGGPVSYAGGLPILLVTPTSIPDSTEQALTDLGVEQVVILGGTAAVSDAVQSDLEDITGNDAVRVAGLDRNETAAAVAEFAVAEFGWDPTEVLLASGKNFPDALSAGPLGGEREAPVLLLASMPPATEDEIDDHSDTITDVTCMGGTAACSQADLDAGVAAAKNTANDGPGGVNATATSKPELVSTTFKETVTSTFATTARPAGTYITYTFDEQVTGKAADPSKVFVYSSDGTRTAATTATVLATDTKSVEGYFAGFNTAALASVLTTATVDDNAVQGQAGAADPNIEGDGGISPTSTATTAAAGVTAAPDLVSVGNFRAGTSADVSAVDFTFDEAAFNQNASRYHLVDNNGANVVCTGPATGSSATPSGGTVPGGEGTTVHTVLCPEAIGAVTWSATSIARGYVDASAVADNAGGTNPNPLQAAEVNSGGTTAGPDLVSAVFAPSSDTTNDIVAMIFDEAVSATVAQTGWRIYNTAGAENVANFAGALRSTENNNIVLTLWTDETLAGATYVGASVRLGQVTDTETPATANGADEVAVAPSSGASQTLDRTDGPDLTGVVINAATSPLGTTTHNVTYSFDEDTSDVADLALTATDNGAAGNSSTGEQVIAQLLHLYLADGIRLDCKQIRPNDLSTDNQTLANRDETADSTVTCYKFSVGTGGPDATDAQIFAAVVGSVDYGAVDDEAVGGDANPEGANVTTGGNGNAAT